MCRDSFGCDSLWNQDSHFINLSTLREHERNGGRLFDRPMCSHSGNVLSDAGRRGNYQGRRGIFVRGENGYYLYMDDRDSSFPFYGICGKGVAGCGGGMPECGPSLQMYSGVPQSEQRKLDKKSDECQLVKEMRRQDGSEPCRRSAAYLFLSDAPPIMNSQAF